MGKKLWAARYAVKNAPAPWKHGRESLNFSASTRISGRQTHQLLGGGVHHIADLRLGVRTGEKEAQARTLFADSGRQHGLHIEAAREQRARQRHAFARIAQDHRHDGGAAAGADIQAMTAGARQEQRSAILQRGDTIGYFGKALKRRQRRRSLLNQYICTLARYEGPPASKLRPP